MKELDKITPIEVDFAKWYTDVVKNGNLISYGQLKGFMTYKPNSYGIWEMIQKEFNKILRENNVENLYMPLLIPISMIEKEKKHVEGFSPELAIIEKVGNTKMEEPYVIRPTSEVLFGEYFSNEIRSYKDLPLMLNQWANIVRWEKTTNPFLRNREFLWQEGHTIHETKKEAEELSYKMIKIYHEFLKNFLAIETIIGEKTEKEKFAGAETTYTIEAMMKDGKALQSGTSHYLGQNFSKAFNITFTNKENKKDFVHQTSWGISTRLIGSIIMSHGDNRGIIIPPFVAPNQVDLILISTDKEEIINASQNILTILKSIDVRTRIDDSNKSLGFKASKSEIEGTPLRIEIGPRDLENNEIIVVRRDTLDKIKVNIENLKTFIPNILKDIHENLYESSKERLYKNIVEAKDYDSFKENIEKKKFVEVFFAGDSKDEDKIKEQTGATSRCIIEKGAKGICFFTNKETSTKIIFAKAY